jgi:hypothetical protein
VSHQSEDIDFFDFGSVSVLTYFCVNSDLMAQKKNSAAYWLLFFVSTAAFIAAWASHFEYLTLILPFVATSFVKAMDIM